ncbi:helix-turn-helix transcriptional regulator [Myroides marinus]|uniref:helix-turn-helix domain-containing protein n=1 Tax=Myroides marinus TaxID=703342 RepID=UPI0025774253|nr:helix-turn-helix transcriptional regulator [Myroides marinus]MDM1501203.1 helix-turn-helix transcriptional regulator [Myroides marinus]
MTLGNKIKELREHKGLMQREVGSIINVDGAFISKIESGEKQISRHHLPTLSNYFSINIEELETLWLADKIYNIIKKEPLGKTVIENIQKELNK